MESMEVDAARGHLHFDRVRDGRGREHGARGDGAPWPLDTVAPGPSVAESEEGSIWVRDADVLEGHRRNPPATDFASPIYRIPRETLFRHVGVPAEDYDLNLKRLPVVGRLF